MSVLVRAGICLLMSLVLAACSGDFDGRDAAEPVVDDSVVPRATASLQPVSLQQPAMSATKPNIVLMLVDDMSMDLLQTMRNAARMQSTGASYDRSFVVDSLCCVSRASLFTGQFPHQTGVRTNVSSTVGEAGPIGGFPAFRNNGNEARSFNVHLQQAGYDTGFVGKYLNEYEYEPGKKPVPPVPPGWTRFNVVFGSAYDGWGFHLLDGEDKPVLKSYPVPEADASEADKDKYYAGTVIEDYALDFIKDKQAAGTPYFLEVAPYAPHGRVNAEGAWPGEPVFPPAFRDRKTSAHAGNCGLVACTDLTTADLPGFGDGRAARTPLKADGTKAKAWNTKKAPWPPRTYVGNLRTRAQMLQSADRTLGAILDAVDDNTYVVFASDNGFHLGQVGLGRGKGTAYDTDTRVPLLVVGPGIKPGERAELALNIDLAPTFEDLAGIAPSPYRSGQSLVPSLKDPAATQRQAVFFEHTSQRYGDDPDQPFANSEILRIPSYVGVRTRDSLLVRYDLNTLPDKTELAYEFYSYKKQPWEKRNQFASPKKQAEVTALMARLKTWDECQNVTGNKAVSAQCRQAMH